MLSWPFNCLTYNDLTLFNVRITFLVRFTALFSIVLILRLMVYYHHYTFYPLGTTKLVPYHYCQSFQYHHYNLKRIKCLMHKLGLAASIRRKSRDCVLSQDIQPMKKIA